MASPDGFLHWEQVAIFLLSVVSGLLGWLMRELWSAVKEQRRDLASLEVKLGEQYVRSSAFEAAVTRILDAIDGLRLELHTKEDRK